MGDAWIVNHGIDTLVVNAYYLDRYGKLLKRDLDADLYAQLEDWKRQAQGVHEPVKTSFLFNGLPLLMQPNGAGQGQYPFLLKTEDITLSVSTGKWNGIASVRFNSVFLWSSTSVRDAVKQVQGLFDDLFKDEMHVQPSAIDLCADVAGWQDIDTLDRNQHFVSRSRKRSEHATPDWGLDVGTSEHSYGLQSTGFEFSPRGAMSAIIYDKTREIQKSGKEWVPDLWYANGYTELDGRVRRVEVRYTREALHELMQEERFHGIENVYTLLDLLPLLWAYGVGQVEGGPDGLPDGWLRCVIPGKDKTRSRWPTHPVWKVVQGAFLVPGQKPEQFGKIVRKRHRDRNVQKGIEAVMGYLTSLAAWVEDEVGADADLSVVLSWFHEKGNSYLDRLGRDFVEEVEYKRLAIRRADG